jgi:hypothetical protein
VTNAADVPPYQGWFDEDELQTRTSKSNCS